MQKIFGAAFLLLIGVGLAFVAYDRAAMLDRSSARRSLESRGTELASRVIAPNSSLACLDGLAGDVVEVACEKSIFGRPETIAAAVAYTSARLDLLNDVVEYARRYEPGYDARFSGLRRAVETDRFGIAGHVLSTRDACTAEKCNAYSLVGDATTLRSNLRARVFSQYVDRHRASWSDAAPVVAAAPAPEVATPSQATPPASSATAALPAPARPAPSARYDFPSAASIPPVSIMNPEPKAPPPSPRAEATEQDAARAKPQPARRPQAQER
jgi:hypothetical protein